jgi:hypothetical protein
MYLKELLEVVDVDKVLIKDKKGVSIYDFKKDYNLDPHSVIISPDEPNTLIVYIYEN